MDDDVWTLAMAGSYHGDGVLDYVSFHSEAEARAKYQELVSERYGCEYQTVLLFKGLPLAASKACTNHGFDSNGL